MAGRRKLVAILSADVVGYSALMGEDDLGTLIALEATRSVVGALVGAHGGRLVDSVGDAMLAELPDAAAALRAAVAIQRAQAAANATRAAHRRMRLRIGLHADEVLEHEQALYGNGVNVAARLQALAEPGGVCLSDAVVRAAGDGWPVQDDGDQTLKNIASPVRVYRLATPTELAPAAKAPPPSPSQVATRGNLPHGLQPLYGRERELDEAAALLRDHRLLCITGPGGIGKTRLALALVHAQRGRWRDGAWSIELAAVAEAKSVPAAVAQSVGIALAGARPPLAELVEALRRTRLLLLLDNCEHVADAVADLAAAVLRDAPEVSIVATSQERLRVDGEQVYRLGPLAQPAAAGVRAALASGAVRLLHERVRALEPAFVLDDASCDAAVRLCADLDGVPLAIELAAARVPLLGIDGVVQRLGERLRLLAGSHRGKPARHRTLQAALEWSHALLTDAEQVVYRRLGVFVGGFSLELMQSVAGDDRLDSWQLAEHLDALVEKSLVVREAGVPPRFRLLETTRADAVARLAAHGELGTLRRRHAEAVEAHLRATARAVEGGDTSTERAHATLAPDQDNLRAAFAWARQSDERHLAISLAAHSLQLMIHLERLDELQHWLDAIEAWVDDEPDPALRARYRMCTGQPPPRRGGMTSERKRQHLERACIDLEQSGNERMLAWALGIRAFFEYRCGASDAATALIARARALARPDWPAWLNGTLAVFGTAVMNGRDYPASTAAWREAVRHCRAAGHARGVAVATHNLMVSCLLTGHLAEAIELGRPWLDGAAGALSSTLASQYGSMLVYALAVTGDLGAAQATARQAVHHAVRADTLEPCCDAFAVLAARQGRLADAARLAGAHEAWLARDDFWQADDEVSWIGDVLRQVRSRHGEGDVERWLAEGAALDASGIARLVVAGDDDERRAP